MTNSISGHKLAVLFENFKWNCGVSNMALWKFYCENRCFYHFCHLSNVIQTVFFLLLFTDVLHSQCITNTDLADKLRNFSEITAIDSHRSNFKSSFPFEQGKKRGIDEEKRNKATTEETRRNMQINPHFV